MSTKKQSITDVYEFCDSINLICLSTEYKNSKSKLNFQCKQCGCTFGKNFIELKKYSKNICHKCDRYNRDEILRVETFQKILEFCDEIGLKCISDSYVNNSTNMVFECTNCQNHFQRNWSVLKKTKSTICKSCAAKGVVEKWKYTYEQVKNIFFENNCILLSKEYENNKQSLDYICECGNSSRISLSNFLIGQRCKKCQIIKGAESRRASIDEVRKIFEDNGCILLSEEFHNSNEKLDYICACGTKSSIKLSHFKNGVRCKSCSGSDSPTIDEVREYFEINNCTLLSEEYINNKSKLLFKCECGNIHEMSWEKYRSSPYKRCNSCANKLNGERIRGNNHPNYNPNLSEENRIDRRLIHKNKLWRQEVYRKDNYTCQCCNQIGKEINAHHLDGYNWCENRRHDVNNGVTLCKDCHILFHQNYGYGNNTSEQFNEFLIKYQENKKESMTT